jgi:hypothetical protein
MTLEIKCASPTISDDELQEITGYRMPAKQLEFLRQHGFWRASLRHDGSVYLERPHFEAVSSGAEIKRQPKVNM